jgi:hypothetical protein
MYVSDGSICGFAHPGGDDYRVFYFYIGTLFDITCFFDNKKAGMQLCRPAF